LVTSQLTLNEAAAGDPVAASERLKLLDGLPIMPITNDAELLANRFLSDHTMPQKAAADALHIALAALARVDYLLTLNCKHIAKYHELPRVYRLLASEGLSGLLICTSAEFLGGNFP
jgi:predicted nucleic acid-binding protein